MHEGDLGILASVDFHNGGHGGIVAPVVGVNVGVSCSAVLAVFESLGHGIIKLK